MNVVKQHYIIDFSSDNNFMQISAMQGDGYEVRYAEIEMIENGQPYVVEPSEVDVCIMGTKPDTKEIWNSCTITQEGYILVEITQQMTAVLGRGEYSIVITHKSQNRQIKSFPFNIITTKAPYDPSYIESTDEFQRLVAAIHDASTLAVKSINDVGDVNITSPQNNQVLKYNSTSKKWENKIDESGTSITLPLSTANGGTGNTTGYIRTGKKAGTTIGNYATAEGYDTTASGRYSHAEGQNTQATNDWTHAEGINCIASGIASHASGSYTIARYHHQTVIGSSNDNKSDTLFEIGNGVNISNPSNAFEVYRDGHININGDIYQRGTKIDIGGGGGGSSELYLTSPVSCSIGATTCTVTDNNIHTTSLITMFSQTSSGVPAIYSKIVTTEGQAVITFIKALTEETTIILNVINQSIIPKIYGAEWAGGADSSWTRTDDAVNFADPVPAVANGNGSSPFDSIMPWAGMKKVENSSAGTLVEIPKYYYKWTRDGAKMKLQISSSPVDGFYVSPAHADRGDGVGERDYVHVGAYHCATSTYKSTTGVQPANSITRANFRTNIHSLGSNIWQYDFAMYWTICMLYLVEYGDWNSQNTIGYGCGNGSATENAGLCDAMIYHTGTNAASRTTYGHTRYRYIEDLWGNVYDWCDGIYFSSANVYCIKNPASFSDTSGGTLVGTRATLGGWTKAWTNPSASGFEYALYPNAIDQSQSGTTYICDYYSYQASGVVLCVGGAYSPGQGLGLFYLSGSDAASDWYASVGARLMMLS